jgi:hypothetical protein
MNVNVKVNFEITKKYLLIICSVFILCAGGIVYALHSGNPTTMGHTGDEIQSLSFDKLTSGVADVGNEQFVVRGEGPLWIDGSLVVGDSDTSATGEYSTAIGAGAEATGKNSVAMGRLAEATGFHSFALGHYTDSFGTGSIAIGASSKAIGGNSLAFGTNAQSYGMNSIALGFTAIANHNHSFVANFNGVTQCASTSEDQFKVCGDTVLEDLNVDNLNVNGEDINFNEISQRPSGSNFKYLCIDEMTGKIYSSPNNYCYGWYQI